MKNLKFLFLLLFLLPFFNVNAEILPKPSIVDIETYDYGITNANSYNATNTTWYDINTYIAYNDHNGFVYYHSSRQNFWYPNNICNNKEITINVKTLAYYSPGNFYEQTTPLKLWNGSTAYTCTLNSTSNNGNVADWTCTGVISNVLMLTFESIDILNNQYYGVGISNSSTYTCNATTSDIINNQNSNTNNIINNQDKNQQQTNEKLDDIYNSDLDESDKQLPDDGSINDYENIEGEIVGKIDDVSFDSVSIGIDSQSSSWVWSTLTSFIESHSAIFGMFIAILSIGIIKLALGR